MLIECPECNTSVSERAVACPKCGCPINSWSDRFKTVTARRFRASPLPVTIFLTLLALVASWVFVPTEWVVKEQDIKWAMDDGMTRQGAIEMHGLEGITWWARWNLTGPDDPYPATEWGWADRHVVWWIVWLEGSAILLIGGALIAVLLRRRRRAQADTVSADL
jgi:hypothetical protein